MYVTRVEFHRFLQERESRVIVDDVLDHGDKVLRQKVSPATFAQDGHEARSVIETRGHDPAPKLEEFFASDFALDRVIDWF